MVRSAELNSALGIVIVGLSQFHGRSARVGVDERAYLLAMVPEASWYSPRAQSVFVDMKASQLHYDHQKANLVHWRFSTFKIYFVFQRFKS